MPAGAARIVWVVGLVVIVIGGVVLQLEGRWADEHQTAGEPLLWLIPLAGVVLVVVGALAQRRSQHR